MSKCQKCNKSFKKISEITKIYPNLPFEERLSFDFCESCGEKHLDKKIKKLIENLKEWTRFEHTGEHFLESLESKDHYKGKRDGKGILGEAPKGIYTNSKGQRYLIKWSKVKEDGFHHGFREIVTEFIMNKMAEKITLTNASSLGKIEKNPVFVTESFIDGKKNCLVHGVEIFRKLHGDDREIDAVQKSRKLQKKFYTLENIGKILKTYYRESHFQMLKAFYKMILVDAWLGNQDRHSENWGVIERKNGKRENAVLAPLFDTSRGLFWNHTLINLHINFQREQREKQLLKYIKNSQPLISLKDKKDADHFDLAAFIRDKDPKTFEDVLNSLQKVDIPQEMNNFKNMMHKKRLDLIRDLLEKRRERLKALV